MSHRKHGRPSLRFLGGVGTVTGSRFLIECRGARLLVECGLFQGLKDLRLRNWAPLPVEASSIDAVVLSHAHLDHSGYLPALVGRGFQGHVYSTPNTLSLCEILLPDSGYLLEEEARYANRAGYSKHHPALPLYTSEDATRALGRFRGVDYDTPFEPVPGIRVTLHRAGHILGSATVHLRFEDAPGSDLLVSGDLGRPAHPVLLPPEPPPHASTILVESTYGNRRHDDTAALETFADAIVRTADRGGMVLIPAFAVDRTEVILFHLKQLQRSGRVPSLPVYVDSPMALAALGVYRDAIASGSPEIRPELAGDESPFDPGTLIEARDVEASRDIHDAPLPAIVISASGMMTGGRILHHAKRRLPDPRNSVILVGYQAEGTRGRTLLDGADSVKLLGQRVQVRAEVVDVDAFSVHADGRELVKWLSEAPRKPDQVYVVHGEPTASEALRKKIDRDLGWKAAVPHHEEVVPLDSAGSRNAKTRSA
jgi:metallo-beta-lactamase family protein